VRTLGLRSLFNAAIEMMEAPIKRGEMSDENTMGLRARPPLPLRPAASLVSQSLDRSLDRLSIAVP
jgi:hypothetical protein